MAKCANCAVYDWKQAANVNLRCKALAGRKPEPLAQHRGAACPTCQAPGGPLAFHLEFSFGRWDNVSNHIMIPSCINREYAEQPTLGFACPGAPDGVISVPLPFPLGEMAGRFRTKVEHTVSLMQSIVFKMDTSGHPIKQNSREGLNELREEVWYASVEVPDGRLLEDSLAHGVGTHRVLVMLDVEIAEVNKLYRLDENRNTWRSGMLFSSSNSFSAATMTST
jgi:hypothetical protein